MITRFCLLLWHYGEEFQIGAAVIDEAVGVPLGAVVAGAGGEGLAAVVV